MTEFWRLFLYIGGGLIFTISVLDSAYRGFRYFKKGKTTADKRFDRKVKGILADDRIHNCPWLLNVERDSKARDRELFLLKEAIITELQPIKNDIAEIKDLNKKLYHAQLTDLQIKLSTLFHEKFETKGTLSKNEQTNWDKWFSDYTSLGGNSDIKRMDELIQKSRMHVALDRAKNSKKGTSDKEEQGEKNET
jgi:hypothetical protein